MRNAKLKYGELILAIIGLLALLELGAFYQGHFWSPSWLESDVSGLIIWSVPCVIMIILGSLSYVFVEE